MEREKTATIRRIEQPPVKTEPERQLGGPQSGFPPPYIIGQGLASWLTVGIDFGSNYCRVDTFASGAPLSLQQFRALAEDAFNVPTKETELVHSLKSCLALDYAIRYRGVDFSAAQATARFLKGVKKRVEERSERLLAKAVLAVPAAFTHRQRTALKEAAAEAEIAVLGLLNEPTAAALDACFTGDLQNGRYLVISAGSYSLEASVVHVQNRLIETKAVRASQDLSGRMVTVMLAEAALASHGDVDLSRLSIEMNKAKEVIGSVGVVTIDLGKSSFSLDKTTASEWLKDWRIKFDLLLTTLLDDAHTLPHDLTGIILSGGATSFWLLREVLEGGFPGLRKHKGNVSSGAAICAALLVQQAKDWVVWDALASPIHVAQGDHVRAVVSANSPLPMNGHAALVPGASGDGTAMVLQTAIDRGGAVEQTALVKIVEPLQATESGTVVDLTVQVTADGTLTFSARHKILDVNLTVEIEEPPREHHESIELVEAEPAKPAEPKFAVAAGCGLIVEQVDGRWFVTSVRETSPAAAAGIRAFDQLLKIGNADVSALGNKVPELLMGELHTCKKLVFARHAARLVFELECKVPAEQHQQVWLNAEITHATIDGDYRRLVQALIDFSRRSSKVWQSPVEAGKAAGRATELALQVLPQNDVLRYAALANSCDVVLDAASCADDPEPYLAVARQACIALMSVACIVPSAELPVGVAEIIYNLTLQCTTFSTSVLNEEELHSLAGIAMGIAVEHSIAMSMYLRIQALHSPHLPKPPAEEDLSNVEVASPQSSALLDALSKYSEGDWAALEETFRLKIGLGTDGAPGVSQLFQIAAKFAQLGDKWLEMGLDPSTKERLQSELLDFAAANEIAPCDSAIQAFQVAESITIIVRDLWRKQDHAIGVADCMLQLAAIYAGLDDLASASQMVKEWRQLHRCGNFGAGWPVNKVCETYQKAGRFQSIIRFCEGQLLRLKEHHAVDRLERMQALSHLVSAYTLESEFALAKENYRMMLLSELQENRARLDILEKFAQFLVRLDDPDAADTISEYERLGRQLGALNDTQISVWHQRLQSIRGQRRFV